MNLYMLQNEDIKVESIPGPCALINALVLSGIDTREFIFVGFLSIDNKERKNKLNSLVSETRTMVFYMSPHKLLKFLADMKDVFGSERNISICREMTKIHEEVIKDNIENVIQHFTEHDIKGEFVVVVEGKNEKELKIENEEYYNNIDINDLYNDLSKQGKNDKEIIKEIAKLRGVAKNDIYKLLKVKENKNGS